MIHIAPQKAKSPGIWDLGSQPIALAAGALVVILLGIGSIALWRATAGLSPDADHSTATRQLQVRTAQASEQLVEKTKGLEVTQQESIDQLQVVQEQLQTVKKLLAEQQADTKRLSDQVSGLTEAIDSLRQSFASVQNQDSSDQAPSRAKPARTPLPARAGHR